MARPRWFALGLVLVLAATAHAQTTSPAPPAAPSPGIDEVAESKVVAVLGLAARGADGKEVGRIVDVLVDKAGTPRAAVIDVGGFLGMGNRKVAVEWGAVRFGMGKAAAAMLALPSDMIKSAPVYDPGKPVEALGIPPAAPAPAAAPPPSAQ